MDEKPLIITPDELKKLISDANAPLTGLEKEQIVSNTEEAKVGKELAGMAQALYAAQTRFMEQAILKQIEKGNIPKWVVDPTVDNEKKQGWLKENGFHWAFIVDDWPPITQLRKGEKVLAEMHVYVHGPSEEVEKN